MIADKLKIGRKLDGRYKLTPEKEAELMEEIAEDVLSTRELAAKYGVSISKVYFMKHPEKKAKKDEQVKKYLKEHLDKDKHNEAQKKTRRKKRELLKRNLISKK